MVTTLRRWLQQFWRWLRSLFGQTSSAPTPPALTDTDYEMEFMAFLEGVDRRKSQVNQQWEALQQKHSEAEWVAWLERLGQKLQTSGEPNPELAQRLIRLGEVGCGELGRVAANLGQTLAARQSAPLATPQLDNGLLEVENNPQTWFNRGRDWLDRDDTQALAAFDRAIALDPNHYRAWIDRGIALSNLNRYEESLAAYDRALELQPRNDLALANRGNSLFDLERYEEAIASWNQALAINAQDTETWHNKGMALGIKLNRWEEAIACFDKTLELQPDDVQTWFNRGIGLAALNRWEDALTSWDRATDLQPDFKDAWINKGVALQRLGRYAEAIAMNQQAADIS